MNAPWHPQSGVQTLKARFMGSVAITTFDSAPTAPNNILNMLMDGILATGVFQIEYTK